MLKRREIAGIYHTSHDHCIDCQTVLNLQAKGIECNHFHPYWQKDSLLRIDGAKELQSDAIKRYCAENDVALQLVTK